MSNQPRFNATRRFWMHYIRGQMQRAFGLNVSQIEPLLFVGGQFRPDQWSLLHALGIRAVLSLQAEYEDRFHGPAAPRSLRLLVRDFTPPAIEQLYEAVQFISKAHDEGLPVLVHCHAGVGRAPLTAAAYLMATRRLSHREAIAFIRAQRPIIGLRGAQLDRLIEWEAMFRETDDGRRTTDEW